MYKSVSFCQAGQHSASGSPESRNTMHGTANTNRASASPEQYGAGRFRGALDTAQASRPHFHYTLGMPWLEAANGRSKWLVRNKSLELP